MKSYLDQIHRLKVGDKIPKSKPKDVSNL